MDTFIHQTYYNDSLIHYNDKTYIVIMILKFVCNSKII